MDAACEAQQPPPLLIMCWNVAGWQTAAKLIVEHYGSVGEWLRRHRCHILCLQEVKYTAKTFEDNVATTGALTPGWESAWSLARPPSGRMGLDGVATFCKTGRMQAADCNALGVAALDCEGRCILTDHGDFVLFNVYTPTSSRVAFKMQFLTALRRAMQQKRASGRAVILAGDLNIKRRAEDVPWKSRIIDFRRAFSEQGAVPYDLPPALAAKLATWGPAVRRVLAALTVTRVPGKSSGATGQYVRKEDSWRVSYTPTDGAAAGKAVPLARPYESEEWAMHDWQMGHNGADQVLPDPDAPGGQWVVWQGDCFAVSQLAEVVTKALGHPFPEAELRALAEHGTSYSAPCLLQWIDALTQEDGMVDTFVAVHPHAEERFTCWNQSTNRRYENDGMRIDYLFCDASLAPRILPGAPLPTGSFTGSPDAPGAALSATTAGGGWKPAPFDGGGVPEAPMSVYHTQFQEPATSIRYMPPSYSDHIAVTLLLADAQPPDGLTLKMSDPATRLACPHKQTRSIKSFFTGAPKAQAADEAAGKPAEGGASQGKKRAGQQSVADMFGAGPSKKAK